MQSSVRIGWVAVLGIVSAVWGAEQVRPAAEPAVAGFAAESWELDRVSSVLCFRAARAAWLSAHPEPLAPPTDGPLVPAVVLTLSVRTPSGRPTHVADWPEGTAVYLERARGAGDFAPWLTLQADAIRALPERPTRISAWARVLTVADTALAPGDQCRYRVAFAERGSGRHAWRETAPGRVPPLPTVMAEPTASGHLAISWSFADTAIPAGAAHIMVQPLVGPWVYPLQRAPAGRFETSFPYDLDLWGYQAGVAVLLLPEGATGAADAVPVQQGGYALRIPARRADGNAFAFRNTRPPPLVFPLADPGWQADAHSCPLLMPMAAAPSAAGEPAAPEALSVLTLAAPSSTWLPVSFAPDTLEAIARTSVPPFGAVSCRHLAAGPAEFVHVRYGPPAGSPGATSACELALPRPPLPTGFAVAAEDGAVRLRWDALVSPPEAWLAGPEWVILRQEEGAAGRPADPATAGREVARLPATATQWTDRGLTNGRCYGYGLVLRGSLRARTRLPGLFDTEHAVPVSIAAPAGSWAPVWSRCCRYAVPHAPRPLRLAVVAAAGVLDRYADTVACVQASLRREPRFESLERSAASWLQLEQELSGLSAQAEASGGGRRFLRAADVHLVLSQRRTQGTASLDLWLHDFMNAAVVRVAALPENVPVTDAALQAMVRDVLARFPGAAPAPAIAPKAAGGPASLAILPFTYPGKAPGDLASGAALEARLLQDLEQSGFSTVERIASEPVLAELGLGSTALGSGPALGHLVSATYLLGGHVIVRDGLARGAFRLLDAATATILGEWTLQADDVNPLASALAQRVSAAARTVGPAEDSRLWRALEANAAAMHAGGLWHEAGATVAGALAPDDPAGSYALATNLLRQGHADRAEAPLRHYIATTDSPAWPACERLATIYANRGRPAPAEALWRDLATRFERGSDLGSCARAQLAGLLLDTERRDEAATVLREIEPPRPGVEPPDRLLVYRVARLLERLGSWPEAIATCGSDPRLALGSPALGLLQRALAGNDPGVREIALKELLRRAPQTHPGGRAGAELVRLGCQDGEVLAAARLQAAARVEPTLLPGAGVAAGALGTLRLPRPTGAQPLRCAYVQDNGDILGLEVGPGRGRNSGPRILWRRSGAAVPARPSAIQPRDHDVPHALRLFGTEMTRGATLFVPVFTAGVIHALDVATGELRWQHTAWGPLGDARLVGDRLYLSVRPGALLVLDAETGQEIRFVPCPADLESANRLLLPVLQDAARQRLVVGLPPLYAVDLASWETAPLCEPGATAPSHWDEFDADLKTRALNALPADDAWDLRFLLRVAAAAREETAVRQAALRAVVTQGSGGRLALADPVLCGIAWEAGADRALRLAAFGALASLQSPALPDAAFGILSDADDALRREVLSRLAQAQANPRLWDTVVRLALAPSDPARPAAATDGLRGFLLERSRMRTAAGQPFTPGAGWTCEALAALASDSLRRSPPAELPPDVVQSLCQTGSPLAAEALTRLLPVVLDPVAHVLRLPADWPYEHQAQQQLLSRAAQYPCAELAPVVLAILRQNYADPARDPSREMTHAALRVLAAIGTPPCAGAAVELFCRAGRLEKVLGRDVEGLLEPVTGLSFPGLVEWWQWYRSDASLAYRPPATWLPDPP